MSSPPVHAADPSPSTYPFIRVSLDFMGFRKFSLDLKTSAVRLFESGHSPEAIRRVLGTSISRFSLNRWRELYRRTNKPTRDESEYLQRGRHTKVSEEERELLELMVTKDPTMYLDEIAKVFEAATGHTISKSTVHYELTHKLGLTRKVARGVHPGQTEESRAAYLIEVANIPPEYLVFTDESAICADLQNRIYGRARKGIRTSRVSRRRFQIRWSLLPAVSLEGVIACMLHEGSITGLDFEFFLSDHLLPNMNPYPGRNSVLVLDNCQVHHGEAVQELCTQRGVRLIYLPPYSPDFNPIEKAFSILKARIRRAGGLAGNQGDSRVIRHYTQEVMTPTLMNKLFRASGY